jgi:hypothetical protein
LSPILHRPETQENGNYVEDNRRDGEHLRNRKCIDQNETDNKFTNQANSPDKGDDTLETAEGWIVPARIKAPDALRVVADDEMPHEDKHRRTGKKQQRDETGETIATCNE